MSSRPSRGAARLAAILDALPDALLLVNRNGTVVNANAMALEVLEAPGTPVVGRGLLDLLPSFDHRRIPGSVRATNDTRDTRTKPTRMSAHRTDGGVFPVEVTSANLPAGYDDELLMIVVRDLTGKVDVEAELARQQRQTEMILRAACEGIIGIDAEGDIVLANPAAARILRHRASDLGGRNVHELLMHARADGTPLPAGECPPLVTLGNGRRQRLRDQVLWRGDEGFVTVDMITAPILLGGAVVGAVMTFSDTAREKSLGERRAQLAELVDTEILGRLEAVRGRLKKVADGGAGEVGHGARRMVRQVAGELESLEELAREVLAHQAADLDPTPAPDDADTPAEPERVPTTVDDLVDRAMETVTYLARGAGVEFAVNASPVGVRVDVDAMTRALGHLLADVVAAGPEGSTVVVAAAQRGALARIEVRGPESRNSTVRVPLARAVVEAHGGTVESHTVAGRGSTYVVELPADEEAAELVVSSGEHRAAKGRRARQSGRPDPSADKAGKSDKTEETGKADKDEQGAADKADGDEAAQAGKAADGAPKQADEPDGATPDADESPDSADSDPDSATASTPAKQSAPANTDRPAGSKRRIGSAVAPRKPATPIAPAAADRDRDPADAAPEDRPAPGAGVELAVRGRGAQPARARLEPVGSSTPPVPAPPPPGSVAPAPQGPFALPAGTVAPVPLVPASGGSDEGRHERPDTDEYDEAEEAARNNSGAFEAVYPPRSRRGRAARELPEAAENPAGASGSHRGAAHPDPSATPGRQPATPVPPAAPAPAAGGRLNGTHTPQGAQARRRLSTPPAPIPAQNRAADGRTTSVQDRPGRPAAADMPTEVLPPIPAAPDQPIPFQGRRPGFPAGPPGDAEAMSGADLPTMVSPAPDGQPRRLLVWPEPDTATAGALTARGWSPLLVRSREEVDASVPVQPAALFVDPLTGPITRTALQSLRTAATAAQIPVLVTAGLMQATRDAAFGADPAVLLRSLAPADSAGHASRVLLVEANPDIAAAFTASLERRGMDVVHAASESEAVSKASSVEPNLVVLDLMLVRRRRMGVVDWLRNNTRLHSTPIVVYTTLDLVEHDLHRLQTGETVLFLAERSTREDVQQRIVDLLGKIASPK
ncbi:PAS domain-containing protein [Embleya hyalina]|uniref:Nickel transporter n=1 Tax=Embleya hyalina TaxID=516124 RepID=A0A401YUD1_9ACTN|nr:PAS domain-containing protein [Embleya hyalina]GCD98233.1 nickel transporter [Embleya hyalina]